MKKINVFELFAKINLDTSEYTSNLEDARKASTNVFDSIKSAGESMTRTGAMIDYNISRPLLNIGKSMMKAGMDYEAGMDQVQAISGATEEEISALGDKAMEMAAKTKFTTAESAEAYKYMAMAGWDAADMLNALEGVMYLAGASGESLGRTSDIVTDAMTAFGLAANETSTVLTKTEDGLGTMAVEVANTTRFVDVLAKAASSSNTNVDMMGETFKYVAPVAGALGYSVEDTAIAIGLMANQGIKASQAGTSLRSILTNMSNPTNTMYAAMQRLGVSLTDDEGNMYSLIDVMKNLREGFNGNIDVSDEFADSLAEVEEAFASGQITEEEYEEAFQTLVGTLNGVENAERAQLAAMLAGKYGMSGLLAIVNATDEDFQKLTESIYTANGATEEMYGVMTDNAEGAVTRLNSAIDVLYTNLAQNLIPTFTKVVEALTGAVNWFGSLDESTQRVVITIGLFLVALGPVLRTIGSIVQAVGFLGSAFSGVISAVTGAGKAISGLFSLLAANPIALIIAAVAALVAAIIVLWNTNEGFRDAVKGIWEAITGFFSAAAEKITAAFEKVKDFFAGLWQGIQDVFSTVVEFFSGLFERAADAVKTAWNAVVEFFSGLWQNIKDIFSDVAEVLGGFFSLAWEAIKTAWSNAVEFFAGIWDGIKGVFSNVVETLRGFFSDAWEAIKEIWGAVVDFFKDVWDGIQDVFSTVAEVLGGFFSAAWDAIQAVWGAAVEFFQGIWDGIKEVFSSVAETLGGFFSSAWDAITGVWDGAVSFFTGIWEDIKGVFAGVGETFAEIGGNIVSGIKDGIAGAWDAMIGWISEKVGGIISAVKGMLGIASPSKVFAGIGENMALGLGEGWNDEYDDIKRQIEQGMTFEPAKIDVSATGTYSRDGSDGASGAALGGGNTFNFYSPKALDAVTAAREFKRTTQQLAMGF